MTILVEYYYYSRVASRHQMIYSERERRATRSRSGVERLQEILINYAEK